MTAPHTTGRSASRRARRPAWLVAAALGVAAWPQLAAASEPPLCAALLTTEEVAAHAPGFVAMAPLEHAEGHSECSWQAAEAAGDGDTFTLTVWDETGVTAGMIAAETPADFFAMLVESAEQVRGTRGEPLAGVSQRSALFDDELGREVYLLTGRGVVHLRAGGLTASQCRELARAAAAP